MLVLGRGVGVKNKPVRTERVQIVSTDTSSTQNTEVLVPEAVQATSSAGETSVPEREKNFVLHHRCRSMLLLFLILRR